MSLERFRRPLATADAADSVKRAACTMRDQGVGCLVVTKNGQPFGIVTDRDLVVRVLAEGGDASGPVGDCTTYGPLTVTVHDTFETAAARMRTHGVRRLPIIDDSGRAVGIVTSDDLLVMLGRSLADVCEGIENRSDATDSC
jgi:CBS domain-containing protein